MRVDNDRSAADREGREVRVLQISSLSFAVIVSVFCSIFGLCDGLMGQFASLRAYVDANRQPPLTITVVLKEMFLGGILGWVGWLVIGFLAGGVMAGIYNIIGKTTGGLSIHIRERDDA